MLCGNDLPLAAGFHVHFSMRVADENVEGRGSVQTCHKGVGMGIQFVDLTGEDRLRLDEFFRTLEPASSDPGSQPHFR
jgi:hypothetical protein